MSAPRIVVVGTTVRIIADDYAKLDVPRRQGFAWSKNAEEYAKQLSNERGWPIDEPTAAEPKRRNSPDGR